MNGSSFTPKRRKVPLFIATRVYRIPMFKPQNLIGEGFPHKAKREHPHVAPEYRESDRFEELTQVVRPLRRHLAERFRGRTP